jgi:tryptophan-rich sensory protein
MSAEGRHLYDEVDEIPVYHLHRQHLRPWDRRLPEKVQAEGDRRQMWTLKPPSPAAIYGHLAGCVAFMLVVGLLPFLVNQQYCYEMWNAVIKPKEIYKGYKALFAMWVFTHISNGFSMWLVYLGEGFSKHQLELLFFGIAVFAELMWIDCVMYVKRLDYGLGCWLVALLFTALSQLVMCFRKVGVAAAFLVPYNIVCLIMLLYIGAFMEIHGNEYRWIGQ